MIMIISIKKSFKKKPKMKRVNEEEEQRPCKVQKKAAPQKVSALWNTLYNDTQDQSKTYYYDYDVAE